MQTDSFNFGLRAGAAARVVHLDDQTIDGGQPLRVTGSGFNPDERTDGCRTEQPSRLPAATVAWIAPARRPARAQLGRAAHADVDTTGARMART